MNQFDSKAFVASLDELLEQLPANPPKPPLKQHQLKKLRETVEEAIGRLRLFADGLDPVKQPRHVFDPSDPRQMARLIVQTLLVQDKEPLTETMPQFYGSGVYALYYHGNFPAYLPISGTETPIYVGKVDPASPTARTPAEQEYRLWRRLSKDHARNIERTENLSVSEFTCRYLVVTSAWQTTAEDYLIDRFRPVWNNEVKVCYGFGKHGDKAATRSNTRSPWDQLHPGRRWAWTADMVPNPKSADEIIDQIRAHFAQVKPEVEAPSVISEFR
jgi:hypothetical protein